MRETDHDSASDPLSGRLASRLEALRRERGLTLEELATATGISRATLSRIERAETSPSAAQLGRLATALGRAMSRLLADVEATPTALVKRADQALWTDPETGFRRRMVSPPAEGLRLEVIEGEIPPGASLAYDAAPVAGLEHHVVMLGGRLSLTVDGVTHDLSPGDCLRFRLSGPTRYAAPGPEPARYLIALGRP
jgi:transcriptional regulator with XRE-family HTH domain